MGTDRGRWRAGRAAEVELARERAESIGGILTATEDITDQTGVVCFERIHSCGPGRRARQRVRRGRCGDPRAKQLHGIVYPGNRQAYHLGAGRVPGSGRGHERGIVSVDQGGRGLPGTPVERSRPFLCARASPGHEQEHQQGLGGTGEGRQAGKRARLLTGSMR